MVRAAPIAMANKSPKTNDGWILPFVVVEWTTIVVGLVLSMAVILMHC